MVPGKTGLDTFAHDIAALLDRLRIQAVVIGGLSMGGQIIMEFRRLYPEHVRGIVFAVTFPQAEANRGKYDRNMMADRLLREGMTAYANAVLPQMLAPRNIDAFPAVAEHVLAMRCATDPAGAAAALRGRADRPAYEEHARKLGRSGSDRRRGRGCVHDTC